MFLLLLLISAGIGMTLLPLKPKLSSELMHKPKETYSTLLTFYFSINLASIGMQNLLTNGPIKTDCVVL